MKALFDAAGVALRGVDVLVNMAGIMKLTPIAETGDALFDQHVAIKTKGVFHCLREAGRRLCADGRIIISRQASSITGRCYAPTAA